MSQASTKSTAGGPTTTPAKEPAKTNVVRTVILLAVLAVVIGLLAYDFTLARQNMNAAVAKIDQFFSKKNAQGVRKANSDEIAPDYVTPDDIHKLLGKSPVWTDKGEEEGHEFLAECYLFGVSPYRNYLWVMYHGKGDTLRFNSQHPEQKPDPAEDYPVSYRDLDVPASNSPNTPPTNSEGSAKESTRKESETAPKDADSAAPVEKPAEEKSEKPAQKQPDEK